MKQFEDTNRFHLNGQFALVDKVVLPTWAKNNHHFILLNYLALEHLKCRSSLHSWIDLIFGIKQQSRECYNLFKALSSEEYVKSRENSETGKLDLSEVSHIAEFGHNPAKLFSASHPKFDSKNMEKRRRVFDILNDDGIVRKLVGILFSNREPYILNRRKGKE